MVLCLQNDNLIAAVGDAARQRVERSGGHLRYHLASVDDQLLSMVMLESNVKVHERASLIRGYNMSDKAGDSIAGIYVYSPGHSNT